MNNFIQNEAITGNGVIKTFTLANNFKAGTLKIIYNGKLFYEWRESSADGENDVVVFDYAPEATDSISVSYYKRSEPNTRNATRYITTRQVQLLSRVTELTSETDENVEKIIREVEKYIDIVCGSWKKYYDSEANVTIGTAQLLTFPRVDDDNEDEIASPTSYPPIPDRITQAALYGLENVFLIGAPNEADLGDEVMESEKLGDYSYKKQTQGAGAMSETLYAQRFLGGRAVAMLRGYVKNYGRLTIKNTPSNSRMNSRKRFLSNK
jgi:hypothetical protein